jgi:hypothetical protein
MADYLAMRGRVAALLRPDENMTDSEGYCVRSLYFDDPTFSARFEKESGAENRTKTRIRVYNRDDSYIRLEKKIKIAGYVAKRAAVITREQLSAILSGETGFLLRSANELLHHFYADIKLKMMKPTVIVDYTREAYTYKPGNVRITFDKDLCAAHGSDDFFSDDDRQICRNVYPPQMLTMEVKYDDFLPTAVKRLIRPYTARRLALSKYVLSLRTMNTR